MYKLEVYNLRKEKFSQSLSASGVANRWNKNEEFVIYAGSSRALSVLELTAHRAFIKIDESYNFLLIEMELETVDLAIIEEDNLPKNWRSISAYPQLQNLGSNWYKSIKELVLKVPSALVPNEFNYLIHTKHPDFSKKVRLKKIESFNWDERLI